MRHFVTGATGFIGRELVRQLRAAGDEVTALVRKRGAASDLRDLGVDLRPGDITDPESVRAAMRGADAVFHLAGWYRIGRPDAREAHRVNVEGTRVVLEAMRDLGVPRGVYTSTVAVFGDTHGVLADESYRMSGRFLSVYDRTKWLAHYAVAEPLMAQGLPLMIVQPGVVYGIGDTSPMQATYRLYFRGLLVAVPARTTYSWGHVEDTAAGHRLALERGRPGESYVIAGPTHSLADALHIAAGITGIPGPRVLVPPFLLKEAAALVRAIGGEGRGESIGAIAGTTYVGSSAKAERELGFRARSLRDGFAEVLPAERARLG